MDEIPARAEISPCKQPLLGFHRLVYLTLVFPSTDTYKERQRQSERSRS
jgi:hypothetical protein